MYLKNRGIRPRRGLYPLLDKLPSAMLKVTLRMYSTLESDSFRSVKNAIVERSSILHYYNSENPVRDILTTDVSWRTMGEAARNLKKVGSAIGSLPCIGVSAV